MKRRIVSLLLAVALLVLPLLSMTSCNLFGNKNDDGKIHITFYHTMGESLRAVLDKYIAEFNKLYPDIVIEHKQVGGYDDVRDAKSYQVHRLI